MRQIQILTALLLATLGAPKSLSAQHLFDALPDHHFKRTYDVLHYKLTLSFDEEEKRVTGISEISFQPLRDHFDSVWFDAVGMDISTVRNAMGDSLRFRNDDAHVTVFMDQPRSMLDTITVRIGYSCVPLGGLFFIRTDSTDLTRRNQIWTQGEESENRNWFPCYDSPDDKATSEVIATVKDSYKLLSNGKLVSESHDPSSGTRTFHWSQEKPHSSYLIMIAAGEYTVVQSTYKNLLLLNYVYPQDSANVGLVFGKTPEIMHFFEEILDYPYPWEKYSHIIIDQFMWGGMENTSAVTLNESYMFGKQSSIDASSDDVIAHELAHQWWGDLITCSDWTHLWLHEGFANYFEALFKRHARGEDEFQYEAYASSSSVRSQEERAGRKPLVSVESYGVNLYQKGAWVLRMLSDLVGEEGFMNAIRHYLRKYQFTNVTTDNFRNAVEESTGEDLDWFFQQWTYGGGHPELEVQTTWESSSSLLRIEIQQIQERDSLTGLFRFPLEIETISGNGRTTHRVSVEHEEQDFLFPLDEEPDLVIIDGSLKVLKSLRQSKSKDEWIFQLTHASTVPSRLEALDGLDEEVDDSDVFDAFRHTVRHDTFREVRAKAVRLLGSSGNDDDDVMEVLVEACVDPQPVVREAAIGELARFHEPEVTNLVEKIAYTDSSDRVRAACIRVMPSIDSLRAFAVASRHVYTESHRDGVRRASLNALRTLKDPRGLAFGMRFTGPEYELATRLSALGLVRETGKENADANGLMHRLISHPSSSIRSSVVRTLSDWGGPGNRTLLEERKAVETDEDVLRVIDEGLELTGKD